MSEIERNGLMKQRRKAREKIKQLEEKNKQLKELNSELISVLKSVRKDINFPELCDGYLVIDILDKVKENEK